MRIRTIVVEEDYDEVRILTELLELKDISVVGIGYDGKQAVKLYRNHKPDVAILGLVMHDFDGYYGLQKIRKVDKNAKVIMLAPGAPLQRKKRLEDLGASTVISMQNEYDQIPEIINNICQTGFLAKLKNLKTRRLPEI